MQAFVWKVDHRIPVQQVARFRSNKQVETEIGIDKGGCEPGRSSQD